MDTVTNPANPALLRALAMVRKRIPGTWSSRRTARKLGAEILGWMRGDDLTPAGEAIADAHIAAHG